MSNQKNTVLDKNYVPANRPYSQDELSFKREKLRNDLRLGNYFAEHSKCKHFYLVKTNGKKEKDIIETKNLDSGNCSVCWKLNKTNYNKRDIANILVCSYCNTYFEEPNYINYDKVVLETDFYNWLYNDN